MIVKVRWVEYLVDGWNGDGKVEKMEQKKRNDEWKNKLSGNESGRAIKNVRCVANERRVEYLVGGGDRWKGDGEKEKWNRKTG